MPELPEVETVARQLEPYINGKKLQGFLIHDEKLKGTKKKFFIEYKVKRVFRLGKEIVLEFQKGKVVSYLSVHLRMSGRLIWVPNRLTTQHSKWVRARLQFSGGELRFVDPRRFGTFKTAFNLSDLQPKGIDPILDPFSSKQLSEMLNGSKQQIKTFLLRQDKIIGLGNIYASEILYDSRVNPERICGDIEKAEVSAILKSTKKILKKAIKNCGTTFSDFQGANGELGSYQNYLEVYGRDGDECRRCGGTILRIVQQQRSTFFCENCQS